MQNTNDKLRSVLSGIVKDLWIVLLDIIAVNAAYFLALLIRFYVNFEFRPTVAHYLTDFAKFAPFYTVFCIIVFAVFRLYNGVWRYAGINDMNRILGASAVTCLFQVLCTALFVQRMPITYYVIGALLQFFFIALIRFAYRIVVVEHQRIATRKLPSMNVMIIGAGEIGHRVIRYLADDTEHAFRPACVIDSKGGAEGKSFDGIPVIGGTDQIEKAVEDYAISCVFIADPGLDQQARQEIRAFCQSRGMELQDYTGYLSNLSGKVSLASLLEAAEGAVTIRIGDQDQDFENGEQALQSLTGRFTVRSVSAAGNYLVIELSENKNEPYAGYDAWVRKHREETGEEISFF